MLFSADQNHFVHVDFLRDHVLRMDVPFNHGNVQSALGNFLNDVLGVVDIDADADLRIFFLIF